MTDLTITLTGDRIVTANDLDQLETSLRNLTSANEADDPIRVSSGALRWRDGGIWLQVTLTVASSVSKLETDKNRLADVAVQTGLQPDTQTAVDEVSFDGR